MEDFSDVHKGDKNGFVENYDSLSDNVKVCDTARVSGNSKVFDAHVCLLFCLHCV